MTRTTSRIGMNVTTIVPQRMTIKRGTTKRKAMPSVDETSKILVVPPSWKLAYCAWRKRCIR